MNFQSSSNTKQALQPSHFIHEAEYDKIIVPTNTTPKVTSVAGSPFSQCYNARHSNTPHSNTNISTNRVKIADTRSSQRRRSGWPGGRASADAARTTWASCLTPPTTQCLGACTMHDTPPVVCKNFYLNHIFWHSFNSYISLGYPTTVTLKLF